MTRGKCYLYDLYSDAMLSDLSRGDAVSSPQNGAPKQSGRFRHVQPLEPIQMTEPVVIVPLDELDESDVEATVPERADAPVSVITERFLKTVVEHVPLDRIEELHLFSPLRQGGVETGIAVIAARVPVSRVMTANNAELALDGEEPAGLPVRERHTVYTARYRLVQKGPERGKWEADVVAEAEAPLITVETVVRGVQRRAGEESEILRFTAKQMAYALHVPWPLAVDAVDDAVEDTVAESVDEAVEDTVAEAVDEAVDEANPDSVDAPVTDTEAT